MWQFLKIGTCIVSCASFHIDFQVCKWCSYRRVTMSWPIVHHDTSWYIVVLNIFLDSFLASHTSEDNNSYDRVIALENKKKVTKLLSQFEAEVSSKALADSALTLPSIEQQADQMERPHEACYFDFFLQIIYNLHYIM